MVRIYKLVSSEQTRLHEAMWEVSVPFVLFFFFLFFPVVSEYTDCPLVLCGTCPSSKGTYFNAKGGPRGLSGYCSSVGMCCCCDDRCWGRNG